MNSAKCLEWAAYNFTKCDFKVLHPDKNQQYQRNTINEEYIVKSSWYSSEYNPYTYLFGSRYLIKIDRFYIYIDIQINWFSYSNY